MRLTEARRAMDRAAGRTVDYLASPRGQKLRRRVAAAMIVTAPLVLRSSAMRRYPAIRLIELLGGTAAVLELARVIREWEPERADRLEAAVAAIEYVPPGGDGAAPSR
jgi:hypothetical protein